MKKMAIVGFGGMGHWHSEFLKSNIKELKLKGVWDVREERRTFAESLGYKAYSSLEEVLQDPEIELITVATPNDFHKPIAIQAMRAGKNVIVEKPATLSADDFEDMMAVAKETGKVFTAHQNRRWDKDYNIVKRIYNEKPIGEVYMLESRVQGSRQVMNGWRGAKINGGGMVYDWGVHLIDQALDLVKSPVTQVYSQLFYIYNKEVDDNFKVMLRFENGVGYLVEISMNCFISQPRWHIAATNGTAEIVDWGDTGKLVRLKDNGNLGWDEKIVYTAAGPTRSMAPRPPETVEDLPLPKADPDLGEFYRNISDAIDGKKELIVKPESVLRVLKVIDAVFESDKTGQSIKVNI